MRASEILGPKGPFHQRVQDYESRPGQERVADAVQQVLADDGVLICEAGTGIGKTFAYLVPALLSGRRVVISTATRALQDQIAERDLPMVQEILKTSVPVVVMKGLSNYLCRRRYKEFLLSEEALRPQYAQALHTISAFQKESESGDLAELVTLAESSPLLPQIASSSETRLGPPCPYFNECFVTRLRNEAENAQIIIVNHHLFFADLSLRGPHPGRVLPDYDAVILDEAHQIEDTAALFFGVRVTMTQLRRLVKEGNRLLSRGRGKTREKAPLAQALQKALEEFTQCLFNEYGTGRHLLKPLKEMAALEQSAMSLSRALDDLSQGARSRLATEDELGDERELLDQLIRRSDVAEESIEEVLKGKNGRVSWIELIDGKLNLSSTPVDLSMILRDRLFDAVPSVALVSATLSTGSQKSKKGFAYVRARLGVEQALELSEPSPFDYERNCLLYLPKDLPPPRSEAFIEQATNRIVHLLNETGGGAFILTTSLSSMRLLHEQLRRRRLPFVLFRQGEKPKDALLRQFRAQKNGVLVATSSFWEGVDVPGDALRLVILEKIPFAVPSDPIMNARSTALEVAGLNPFTHLALPQASIALKQGFGRLIRRGSDRGIVAILDDRLSSKGYGKLLLSGLPPAGRTHEYRDVKKFAEKCGWRRQVMMQREQQ